MGGRFTTPTAFLALTFAVAGCGSTHDDVRRVQDTDPLADARTPADAGAARQTLPDAHVTAASDSGSCTLVARQYDPSRDCYEPEVTLTTVCLYETEPETTAGTGEIACLVAPDGSRYAIAKGYTECLVDAATRAGWLAKGDAGLCERGSSVIGPDGGTLTDEACNATISRGYWVDGPFAPTLDFATNADAGGPRDGRVGQCQ